MAYVAIRRRQIAQHQEWMIRSYVTTFAFVLFRVFVCATQVAGVSTLDQQLTASAWICWSVPPVITEVVLQSRRILTPPSRLPAPRLAARTEEPVVNVALYSTDDVSDLTVSMRRRTGTTGSI